MTRTIISIETASEMIWNMDSNLINCRLDSIENFWWDEDSDEGESGDLVEGEGGRELIIDREGNILKYEGWYSVMDSNGNWEG